MFKNLVLCSLLSTTLFGCGSSDSGASKKVLPSEKIPPTALNVKIDGEARIGNHLNGLYVYQANEPNESDGSKTYWLKNDGGKVVDGSQLFLNNPSLQGENIKFCVLPINSGNRVEGTETCSELVYVEVKEATHIPTVTILDFSINHKVNHKLTALVDGAIDNDYKFRWYKNDIAIAQNDSSEFRLTKVDEGARIYVCTIDKTSNKDKFCSEKTALIEPADGSAPITEVSLVNIINAKTKIGDTISVNAIYSDKDSDEEDLGKRQYRWYTENNQQAIATSQRLLVSPTVLNTSIHACVTVYAQTGNPKFSQPTCTKPAYVIAKESVAPIVSKITVEGIAVDGYRLRGGYSYFDGNDDKEGKSTLEWKLAPTSNETIGEGDTLRLNANMVKEALSRNTATPAVYFCVTPYDENGIKGELTCQEQRLATITFKGSLTADGELAISDFNYPEFNVSWWQTKGNSYPYFMSLDKNRYNLWQGPHFTKSSLVSSRYKPVQFCVTARDIDGNEQNVCQDVTNEFVTGAPLGGNKVGFEPLPYFDITVASIPYRLYRPILSTEFNNTQQFPSAQTVIYDTFLGKETDDAKGIKLTPAEAIEYCKSHSTRVVPNEVLHQAFFSDGPISIIRDWSDFRQGDWVVMNDKDEAVVYGSGYDLVPGKDNQLIPLKADENTKYRFICSSSNL